MLIIKMLTFAVRNDGKPDCSLCRHRQTSCTFFSKPKVRKGAKRTNSQKDTLNPLKSPALVLGEVADLVAHDARKISGNMDQTDLSASFSFSPFQMDNIDLNFLAQVDARYLVTEKQINPGSEHFNSSTSIQDRTCLYSGASSEQGPFLLRRLVYDQLNCFGDDRQLFWKVEAHQESTYFTVYPNHHLDCHAGMYEQEHIEAAFAPFQDELIDLYFTYVHPSFPVLCRSLFENKRVKGCLPASLLALVYLHGSQFWHVSSQRDLPSPDRPDLHPYIFSCLNFEARTPNLAVIQAVLLYTQLPARLNRAPNNPGIWTMTSMLTGMAQDIGLHIDPSGWRIVPEERKLRRLLWWAVFIHEKNMAHWLGRPSHIKWNDWHVDPLDLEDFEDGDGRLDDECVSWANAFIAMASLSLILSDLLEGLYSVRSNFQIMSGETAARKGRVILDKLHSWRSSYSFDSISNAQPYQYTAHITALAVELSIQRAIIGSNQALERHDEFLLAEIDHITTQSLFGLLDSLMKHPVHGLWLNYNKGSLSMIGSLFISQVLSSTSDTVLNERKATLLEFHSRLQLLVKEYAASRRFDFARFPLRRVNLILEEIFGDHQGSSATTHRNSSVTTSPLGDEANETLWMSYRIAFP
jgi:hypothetical protein